MALTEASERYCRPAERAAREQHAAEAPEIIGGGEEPRVSRHPVEQAGPRIVDRRRAASVAWTTSVGAMRSRHAFGGAKVVSRMPSGV